MYSLFSHFNQLHIVIPLVILKILSNANAQLSQEMIDKGRTHYQFLQIQSQLPQYGSCWKSAILQVEEDCRQLSEETQSDMALSITNCFLESSGHQTYNCQLDKKPNLRQICLTSMPDRAFNVYTEFYTHVMNICWFLRGQVWHDIITDNTHQLGRKMEESARQQMEILSSQRESLEVQRRIIEHGQQLETVLGRFYEATERHQETIGLMGQSLSALHSWMMGELAWFDAAVFYGTSAIFLAVFTAGMGAVEARLPILGVFVGCLSLEKLVWIVMSYFESIDDFHNTQTIAYSLIWWIRRLLVIASVSLIFYKVFVYRKRNQINNHLLHEIIKQNVNVFESLSEIRNILNKNNLANCSIIYENDTRKCDTSKLNFESSQNLNDINNILSKTTSPEISFQSRSETPSNMSLTDKNKNLINHLLNIETMQTPSSKRYNLRSRQGTPIHNKI